LSGVAEPDHPGILPQAGKVVQQRAILGVSTHSAEIDLVSIVTGAGYTILIAT
jgi:hypothetical protein